MMKLLSAVLLAAFASVADAQCTSSSIPAPAPNHPYKYVVGQGANLDQYLCVDFHLATFTLDPSPGGALVSATLTMSAYDVDPTEDNNVLVDSSNLAGPMHQGGNNCWSVTSLDVTSLVSVGGTHDIHIDIDTAGGWCAQIDWVALELVYDNGVGGDPHFKTWGGEPYDFHGVCDLVLLSNPQFKNNLGMDVHIRTEKTRVWSYVSSAAVRIGGDTLEVRGGADETRYWINGNRGAPVSDSDTAMMLPVSVAGHAVSFKQLSPKAREFVVDLENGAAIHIKTWNAYVGVSIRGATDEDFKSSVGLMGAFPHGAKMARDNATQMNDSNAFGQEWQVLATEPKLFHNVEGPQAPGQCHIPSPSQMRRRLGESVISKDDAELACARVSNEEFDLCVFDVMATNDKNTAGAY